MIKKNILVPMAGLGSRFLNQGYKLPKQLINIKNSHLIDISMSCINIEGCNLIFVVRDDQVFNFSVDTILRQKYGDDVKIVVLDKLTDGSVASCLAAEKYIDNDAPLIIHTLDIEFAPVFEPNILDETRCDGLILTFKSNSPNYSYAKFDPNMIVEKTAEKKAISGDACVGIYCFRSGALFCKYAREMIEGDIRTNNEFYIAPLYNQLIADGLKVIAKRIEKMHVFGTPEEYEFYRKNVIKRIGDKPIALCSDHSGFHAKELFKKVLIERDLKYIDFGTMIDSDCDYRDYIRLAAQSISEGECDFGFGFCRTGQGVNICANKFRGIRSALIYDEYSMEMSIRHNCANFFALPSKEIVSEGRLIQYLEIATNNSFDGGRHQIRIQELE